MVFLKKKKKSYFKVGLHVKRDRFTRAVRTREDINVKSIVLLIVRDNSARTRVATI